MLYSFKCITFDLDDTLWPVAPTISAAEAALYAWLQERSPKITTKYSLEDLADQRNVIKQTHTEIAHDVTALRLYSLQILANEFGYSEQLAGDAMAYFREHRNRVVPYADTEATLETLSRSFILGAITNGNAQLEQIEIGRFFSFCVTAEEAGASKPNPKVFNQAITQSGLHAENILHVGDCAHADVLGATNAGLKSVWMNPQRKPWPGGQSPYAVIHALSELLPLLDVR